MESTTFAIGSLLQLTGWPAFIAIIILFATIFGGGFVAGRRRD